MDWKPTFEQIMAERRRELGEPPSTAQMLALRAGELTDDERDRLLERASVDPEVARELFDLLRFPLPADDDAADADPADDERGLDQRWQAFRARLAAEATAPVAAFRPPPAQTPAPAPSRARRWLPLAASFVAGLALAGALAQLRAPSGSRGEAREPQLNLPIVELLPVSEDQGERRGAAELVTLPAHAGGLVVSLAVPGLARGGGPYQLEVLSGGAHLLRVSGLVPGEGGVFVLTLPRGRLVPGTLELLLTDADPKLEGRFRLELELPP